MVHEVKLKNGVAEWYKNRWVRSYSVSKALGEEIIPGACNQVVDALTPISLPLQVSCGHL